MAGTEISKKSSLPKESFIYQLIYNGDMQSLSKVKNSRSPTLDTVQMVEKAIDKYSGTYNRTQLWKKLPKKIMWQTFLVAIDYLEKSRKIAIDKEGKIGYIWDPELARYYYSRKDLGRK